jgi:hypothetical protein
LIAARPILSELDLFRADPARFGHATPFRVTHVPFNLILLNLAINARDAMPAGGLPGAALRGLGKPADDRPNRGPAEFPLQTVVTDIPAAAGGCRMPAG